MTPFVRERLRAITGDSDERIERRFGGMNMDKTHDDLGPMKFDVFVRHCGAIDSRPDADVVALCRESES